MTNKRGIGIMEVMVAALVLGLLYAAVSNLQKGNREALLRIRGRDGATEVAQNVIDSIGTLGLAKLSDMLLAKEDQDGLYLDTFHTTRSWEGQPGLISHTITVPYTVIVGVSPDSLYLARHPSMLDTVEHVYAKRVDVIVKWPFKASTQSISVSGVVR